MRCTHLVKSQHRRDTRGAIPRKSRSETRAIVCRLEGGLGGPKTQEVICKLHCLYALATPCLTSQVWPGKYHYLGNTHLCDSPLFQLWNGLLLWVSTNLPAWLYLRALVFQSHCSASHAGLFGLTTPAASFTLCHGFVMQFLTQ